MSQSTLPRLGLNDFLGTLPAGFYTLIAIYSLVHSTGFDPFTGIDWNDGSALFASVIVFMASFLIGSIYRAAPVSVVADRLASQQFPYVARIARCLNTLNEFSHATGGARGIELPPDPCAKEVVRIFDFWKAVICNRSPHLFNHIKTLEAKVRFWFGMVIAGCAATLLGVFQLLFGTNDLKSLWLLCSPLLVLFGWWALLRARQEEVSEVVWAYVAVVEP